MNRKRLLPLLDEGFRRAEVVTRDHARTFYFASRFLSPEKRRASYAVYAACRLCDQAVDDMTPDPLGQLEMMRVRLEAAYDLRSCGDDPLMEALRETIVAYDLPRRYFEDLSEGMKMDLTKRRYASFAELFLYCYRVAGVVGLMMAKIFGAETPEAEKHALDTAIAMQLTNILRDIKEDLGRGRIYLPQDEMAAAGVTEETIRKGDVTAGFLALMRRQIERTRSFYREGHKGIEAIIDKNARLVAMLMTGLYERILDKIEQQHYNVFKARAVVPLHEKIWGASRIILGSSR